MQKFTRETLIDHLVYLEMDRADDVGYDECYEEVLRYGCEGYNDITTYDLLKEYMFHFHTNDNQVEFTDQNGVTSVYKKVLNPDQEPHFRVVMVDNEKGIYTIFTALMLVMLMFVLGFAIDSGKLELDRTRLQRAADAGAVVAGSRIGNISTEDVESLAVEVAKDNMDLHGHYYDLSNIADYITATVTNNTQVDVDTKTESETFIIGKVVNGSTSWTLTAAAASHKRPVAVVLVVDVSGSMAETSQGDYRCQYACDHRSRLDMLKTAATAFVNSFDEDKDIFSVVSYSDTARIIHPITDEFNKETVISRINSLQPSGWTNTHDGVVKARAELNRLPDAVGDGYEAFKKVIVLITDGAPNRISNENRPYPNGCPQDSTKECVVLPIIEADLARQEGAIFFGIGIGQEDPITNLPFQTQPTDRGSGIYYLKNIMFRRIVNDQVEGWQDPQFPESCFVGYDYLTAESQGQYLQSPNADDIHYMLNQVSLAIQLRLTK